jgi:hypothetical protein
MGGISTGQGPHISIKDNRFTLVDAAGNERPIQTLFLDVCIIDANPHVSKIYYDPRVKYDPSGDNNNPPICFSDNGIGASAQAAQPQNTSCQLCPHNAWGSATSQMTGKQTKACNDVKKLAVMVPGMPDQVFMLRVPPASLKNLAKYTQTVAGHGVDLPDVVTRLQFESQGVLKFDPVGYIDPETAQASEKLWAKGTDMLLGKNDRPWGGQADAQKLAYAQQQTLPPPPPAAPAPAFVQAPPASMPPPPPGYGNAFPAGPAAPAMQPPAPPAPQATPRKPRQKKAEQQVDANAPAPFVQAPPNTVPVPFQAASGPINTDIPDFLRVAPDNAAPPAPPAPGPAFGMHPNPPAPDAGIQSALDEAFRLPT